MGGRECSPSNLSPGTVFTARSAAARGHHFKHREEKVAPHAPLSPHDPRKIRDPHLTKNPRPRPAESVTSGIYSDTVPAPNPESNFCDFRSVRLMIQSRSAKFRDLQHACFPGRESAIPPAYCPFTVHDSRERERQARTGKTIKTAGRHRREPCECWGLSLD